MNDTNRRSFLKTSMLAAGAMALPARSWARVIGTNDTVRLAVVGFNGQGKSHIEGFRKVPGVQVVALCDVDQEVLNREAAKFKERGEPIQTYTDVRKLLENPEIDAISTATPNHWHALISIWACQAGKDVYVEKPVSHNVWEGRQIVEAARKYKRIVQTGTQSRSNEGMREAIHFLHSGGLGRIKLARGLCYKRRKSIGKVTAPTAIPSTIDYDMWCGPSPKKDLMRSKLHYDWHWVWETGNGDLGNQGIHQMDLARWALRVDQIAPRTWSLGGRFGYVDDGTTPNTEIVYHDYPGGAPIIFEVRGLPEFSNSEKMGKYRGADVGVVVDCEHGFLVMPSYASGLVYDRAGKLIKKFDAGGNHHANFIKAVRSRKPSDLNAEILEGHLSSALCHTGNISYRLGQKANPGEVLEQVKGHPAFAESFGRCLEHLAVNGVDINSDQLVLGAPLEINPKTEKIKNNPAGNAMLTREYRHPFVVPAKV